MKLFFVLITIAVLIAPLNVLEARETEGTTPVENLESSMSNLQWGWTELVERTHQEAAKGENAGEQLVGVMAGSAIGLRKGIHRIGAGAIDLLTFWIPKKQPLIKPDDH